MTAISNTPLQKSSSAYQSSLREGDGSSQTNALGGPDPEKFDCLEAWYPVHYLQDLDKSQLTRFTLLGKDLVIWWDVNANQWRAFDDRCPHRLVPLSEGRIAEDGLLECPYHGWAFTGEGACDRIPQQPAGGQAETAKRACVTAYPTSERQGLLFVYPGQAENAPHVPVPIVEPLEDDPDGWVCLNTFRDVPYDALTLLENVLDSSHLPFTHHRSVGNRANASPVLDLSVTESGKPGFQGRWEEGPRRGTLGPQDTTFRAPSLMWHDLTSKQFGRTLTVVYATPIRKGECRLFARFPFKFSSPIPAFFIKSTPRWYSHLGQNSVLEDDQIFLHHQERTLAALGESSDYEKACYLPTQADAFVLQLRRWVTHFQADPFAGQSLSPALSQAQLLDRYHSHTEHCASCRKALKNLQRIRLGSAIIGAIALAVSPLLALTLGQSATLGVMISTGISLLGGGLWLGLGNLERQFYQGREIPLRNLPEKARKKA